MGLWVARIGGVCGRGSGVEPRRSVGQSGSSLFSSAPTVASASDGCPRRRASLNRSSRTSSAVERRRRSRSFSPSANRSGLISRFASTQAPAHGSRPSPGSDRRGSARSRPRVMASPGRGAGVAARPRRDRHRSCQARRDGRRRRGPFCDSSLGAADAMGCGEERGPQVQRCLANAFRWSVIHAGESPSRPSLDAGDARPREKVQPNASRGVSGTGGRRIGGDRDPGPALAGRRTTLGGGPLPGRAHSGWAPTRHRRGAMSGATAARTAGS